MNIMNKPSCSIIASTSSNEIQLTEKNDDLIELDTEGISVWGQYQEILEEQALEQIQTLAEEHATRKRKKKNDEVEEGEITEDVEQNTEQSKESSVNKIKTQSNTFQRSSTNLDIQKFIQRQEELKKRQQHSKQLKISERSKNAAECLSKKQINKVQCTKKVKKQKTKKIKTIVTKAQSSIQELNYVKFEGNENSFDNSKKDADSDSDYVPTNDELSDSEYMPQNKTYKRKKRFVESSETEIVIPKVKDDGDINYYKARLENYYQQLEIKEQLKKESSEMEDSDEEISEDFVLSGLKIPKKIWLRLFNYQQDGVEWLWKIHQKQMGGLLGDEMGLGKTVQIIAFLASLSNSKLFSKHGRFKGLGATLIVSPVTVVHQWVQHFHEWWPEFRVAVLHQSGSYNGNKNDLIKEINRDNSILITTYNGLLKYKPQLSEVMWHYLILDEGHKIRNPTAQVSVAVKRFQAEHRLLLTGSPMQNNLQELWSLFDFIAPGVLGTQQVFTEHFSNPIMQGGYMNATQIQEATALSVATTLKDIISPHMLRRSKADVHNLINLPHKSEQVLFCSLTTEQIDLYKGYLMSDHINNILGRGNKNWFSDNQRRANMLVAITTLRKICNHPDLYLGDVEDQFGIKNEDLEIEDRYGYYKRSGKMVVVSALLKIWKRQGHRVLLFTQTLGMIAIFETFLKDNNYKFLKMDGTTNIGSRQSLINTFNHDNTVDVFLLTTRVGGLGVNLTGANRVIIYDPDWNPAIDTQARERAWRIGQKKEVTIYRLLSAGTIEEKMYQRQVWKQLLSNKVLVDPRTQRVFKTSDLHDLFSLQEPTSNAKPETESIFRNSKVEINEEAKQELEERKEKKHSETKQKDETKPVVLFDEDKIKEMRKRAALIAKSLSPSVPKLVKDPEKEEAKQLAKTLTPSELREWNRKKGLIAEPTDVNKVDDSQTNISFSTALQISEKKSKLYKKKKINAETDQESSNKDKNVRQHDNKNYKEKDKQKGVKIDNSGKIDGEEVAGLVKREIKKTEKVDHKKNQDDYVLHKLFSRSGVSTALQHDVIVQSGYKGNNSLKLRYESQKKAEKALKALRKSRLDNWNW